MILLKFRGKLNPRAHVTAFLNSSARKIRAMTCFRRDFSSLLSPVLSFLQPSHDSIIKEEEQMLSALLGTLRSIDAPQDDIDLAYDTRSRIDDLFLIVIVGEFNSGKSTLINSLIGKNLLKAGVLPTTNKICILRHQDASPSAGGSSWQKAENMLLGDVQEIKIDLNWLKNIAIVDTPGTNAIVSSHEQLTTRIIPRADLILFMTSAERPMSDSESSVLSNIKQWNKKVVMIVNKMDVLSQASEKEEVLDFVSHHAAKLLGKTVKQVPIFGVSGKLALNSKLMNPSGNKAWLGASSWQDSKMEFLERYLMSVLSQEDLIKCKLRNPLGISERIITDSMNSLQIRKSAIEGDFRILEMIEENMAIYVEELEREINVLLQQIKLLLNQMKERCNKFLDQKLTILNSYSLLTSDLFGEEFKQEVLMDLRNHIDDIVQEMCNVITKKSKIQANSVVSFVGNRPRKFGDSLMGPVNLIGGDDAQFDATRIELRLRRNVKAVIESNLQSKAIQRDSDDIKSVLIQAATIQGVSVTVGAAASTNMLGLSVLMGGAGLVPVFLGVGGSMALGMYLLPRKKDAIRLEFSQRIEILESQLSTVILNDMRRENQSNEGRIRDSIAPYSRFIEIENKKISRALDEFHALQLTVRNIQNKLE